LAAVNYFLVYSTRGELYWQSGIACHHWRCIYTTGSSCWHNAGIFFGLIVSAAGRKAKAGNNGKREKASFHIFFYLLSDEDIF
jgi:hypothetical protein